MNGGRDVRRGIAVCLTGDGLWMGQGFSGCSAAELRIRLVDLIWWRRGSGEYLQFAYLFPGWSLEYFTMCLGHIHLISFNSSRSPDPLPAP